MQLESLVVPLKLDKAGFQLATKAVAAGVASIVAGMAVAVKMTMDWATDLDSLGDVMDGTNKDFAALAFVARKSGVGVDALVRANVLLNKSLLKIDGQLDTVGKALEAYGIDVKNVNGTTKTSIQLTDEIAKKYGELETAQERVNFLTEIYGRSGAEMVDFFDTLNAEGGISAVTKKVEALGLAIDPSRYEMFNRNLEELKLVGLGVAVAFTEKLMPILERFLDWAIEVSPEVKKFADMLITAFQTGDFSLVVDAIGQKLGELDILLAEKLDAVNWTELGDAFGDAIEEAFGLGIEEVELPQFAVALGEGIKEFFIAAVGEENMRVFKEHFVDYIRLQLNNMDASFNTWAAGVVATTNQWGQDMVQVATDWMLDLAQTLEDKLRQIGQTFFARALGWTQQARNGFNSGLSGLLDAVSELVGEVNKILKKIITSFTISIKLPDWLTGGGNSGSVGGGNKPPKNARATGGPVLAGHAYNVVELNRPEVFIPNTSGRIEQKKDKPTIAMFSDDQIDRLVMRLTEASLKAAG